MRRIGALCAAAVLAVAGVAHGEEVYSGIDLSSFEQEIEALPEVTESPYCDVGCLSEKPCRRFYITGLTGASFASFTAPNDPALGIDTEGTVFAAGAAVGMSLERQRGRLRLEVEGLGRDVYAEPFVNDPGTEVMLTNNWSVTANLWRDFMFTDRFGIYAGGGLGGGGYKLGEQTIATGDTIYVDAKGAFAWQVGAGLIYELTDRLTVDVSYRYYELDTIQQSSFVTPNQFSSSEVMVGLRLYEPFRHWRK